MLSNMTALNRIIATICLWFSAFGLTVMTGIVGWQVFARYILNDPPIWSERVCLLLMLYFILFAAAAGIRDKSHIGLVIFRESLPTLPKKIATIITHLIILAFGAGMIWFGKDMVVSTWTHTIPTLGIPTGISYLPFPLSGILFVLFSLEHICSTLCNREES